MSEFENRELLFSIVMNQLYDLELQQSVPTGRLLFESNSLKLTIDVNTVTIYVCIHMYHNKSLSGNVCDWKAAIYYNLDTPDIITIVNLSSAVMRTLMYDGQSTILSMVENDYFFTTEEDKYFQLSTVNDAGASIDSYKRFKRDVIQRISKHQTLAFTDGDKCVTLRHPQKYF